MSETATRAPKQGRPADQSAQSDPFASPAEYLLGKGWKCLGDPSWQTATWLDPTKPAVGYESKEPVFAPGADGKPARVMAPNGKGGLEPAEQTVWHPPADPVPLQLALLTQIERDRKAE